LTATPALVRNGDTVQVSWGGIPNPDISDYIALYCPKHDDYHHYLDYFYANVSQSWRDGTGSRDVLMYNMRSDCEFRYIRGTPQTLAVSNTVSFLWGLIEPLQGHIALTGDPTQMRITWVSGTDSLPSVLYGESQPEIRVTGSSRTYSNDSMCGPPASSTGFWDPGYIHEVLLTGLRPDTVYQYSYGSTENNIDGGLLSSLITSFSLFPLQKMSAVRSFHTAPIPGPDVPFKFVVYGDMGVSAPPGSVVTARLALQEVIANKAAFIFHVGDISYARGYAYVWEQWHTLIEPYATLVPYMVGIGNHEQDHTSGGAKDPSGAPGDGFHPWWGDFGDDSGGECGVPMYQRFRMPDNGNALWWYSFDYGSVHFVMMSTEHNFTRGSPQYEWLERDLRGVDRKTTPWVILGGHRPMYTSEISPADYIVSKGMQHAFEDLLSEYHVDLALWGHYHAYERTCPVYNQKCQAGATTHIIVGTAGWTLDPDRYWKMDWSMYHDNEFGYGRITVHNSTAMYWEWVRNRDNAVVDVVWLTK
ncbi:predicted protein, partial [Nematostella vectensis]